MEKHITLPLTEELAKTLHAGDTVYLTGTIYTSRDAGHKRMCEALARGEELPFDPQTDTRKTGTCDRVCGTDNKRSYGCVRADDDVCRCKRHDRKRSQTSGSC